MNILSLQSHVAYGHVGNAAAVFALQRLGFEVWPVHTVQLSNHTGYATWRGRAFDAAHVREVVQGIGERGAFAQCDGVLSGYVGSAAIGEAVAEAAAAVKAANPKALYCCDPVMGDAGKGLFVAADVADFVCHRLVPAADIVTPNHFELDRIAGRETRTLADALAAVQAVHAHGPKVVLVTSLVTEHTPADAIDLVVSGPHGRQLLRTPRCPVVANGAGDLVAALFLGHYLRSGSAPDALSRASSSVFGVVRRTAEARAPEMLLIAAQEELVAPTRIFQAEPL